MASKLSRSTPVSHFSLRFGNQSTALQKTETRRFHAGRREPQQMTLKHKDVQVFNTEAGFNNKSK